MLALTVHPGGSGALRVEQVELPEVPDGHLLVEGISLGICATDHEVVSGRHGSAPPGRSRLVLGHESLGRALTAPPGSGFLPGDLVVGVVRRPDPEPCAPCAQGEFDMCRNDGYSERGLKELDGYGSQYWVVEPDFCVAVDPRLGHLGVLIEPTTVAAKAWEQVAAVGSRSFFEPASLLVTGAGPVGLLIAMTGVQRGLDVHVVDRVVDGPKPGLVRDLGATYHANDVGELVARLSPEVIIEATGSPDVVAAILSAPRQPYRVTCLAGLPEHSTSVTLPLADAVRDLVLGNNVVVGSINANLRHYRQAADALAAADTGWLERLITRRVLLADGLEAFVRHPDDVKVVLDLQLP